MLFSLALSVLSVMLDPQRGSLQEAAQAFDDAQFHHNKELVNNFLSVDFQYVTRKGRLLGRDAFIASTTSQDENLEPFVVSDHRVLALGEGGGIASGDATVRGVQAGKHFSTRFRYADVFERRDGRWLVIYTQVTALPDP